MGFSGWGSGPIPVSVCIARFLGLYDSRPLCSGCMRNHRTPEPWALAVESLKVGFRLRC